MGATSTVFCQLGLSSVVVVGSVVFAWSIHACLCCCPASFSSGGPVFFRHPGCTEGGFFLMFRNLSYINEFLAYGYAGRLIYHEQLRPCISGYTRKR